jgi:hypothetical protein
LYWLYKRRRAYFFWTFRCIQMSAEPFCTISLCWFIIEIFVCAFSLQTNWVSIRTDTSHWQMKWIPPSQNWLVISHIHYMNQQVNWTRILYEWHHNMAVFRLFLFAKFGFQIPRLSPSRDIFNIFHRNKFC